MAAVTPGAIKELLKFREIEVGATGTACEILCSCKSKSFILFGIEKQGLSSIARPFQDNLNILKIYLPEITTVAVN